MWQAINSSGKIDGNLQKPVSNETASFSYDPPSSHKTQRYTNHENNEVNNDHIVCNGDAILTLNQLI